jgi:sugar lactone lactonase YvrE
LGCGWLFGALAFLLAGCAPTYPNIQACEDSGDIHTICGLQNPEDLALVPGGKQVVISQFGSMDGSRPGNLAFFDVENEAVQIAFEGGAEDFVEDPGTRWGDPNCPGAPSDRFSPHGLDLASVPGFGDRLLVVNHGGREAVEFFELIRKPNGFGLVWRGCAVAPEEAFLNDVVNLSDGGFLVTQMMPRENAPWNLMKAAFGFDTGWVYEWERAQGFSIAQGTEAPFPNGIELSEDEGSIFLNVYSPGEVRKINRSTGQVMATVSVPAPDNVTWGKDGRLLVASHHGGLMDQLACMDLESGACGMGFSVVSIDPETLETAELFTQAGAPMGAGTVVLDLGGGEYLIGSFAADRMLRIRLAR